MKHRAFNSLNDQLGDPVTTLETDRTAGISIEQRDPDLATVPRIHSSRSVHQRNAVPRGQARTRMHECGIAVRQRNGHASGHYGPLAGAEFHIGGGEQIGARVAGMSTDRQRDTRIQSLDKDMHRVRSGIRYRPGGRSLRGVHGRDLTADWVIPPTFRPGPARTRRARTRAAAGRAQARDAEARDARRHRTRAGTRADADAVTAWPGVTAGRAVTAGQAVSARQAVPAPCRASRARHRRSRRQKARRRSRRRCRPRCRRRPAPG